MKLAVPSFAMRKPRARGRTNWLARIAAVWLGVLCLISAFAEFIAPYGPVDVVRGYVKGPPQAIHILRPGEIMPTWPYVHGTRLVRDMTTFQQSFQRTERAFPIQFFVRGSEYRLLGLFETDIHLFGVGSGGTIALLGTDQLGRDVFSRTLLATRVSLSVPLAGMLIGVLIGSVLGVVSAYIGGLIDLGLQRISEVLMAFPRIPLWMALATVLPAGMPSYDRYLLITILLASVGWTELYSQIRSKTYSLKDLDFVLAARVSGTSNATIVLRHLLPNCFSHIIVVATLAVPSLILAESSLSFLGVGIVPPLVSWGTLLRDAQDVQSLVFYPWLLAPGVMVALSVLAFNLCGDALRDRLDPNSVVK